MTRILSVLLLLTLAGCGGAVVKNIDTLPGGRTDGAMVGYYLPTATWAFHADWDGKGTITLKPASDNPLIIPDTSRMYHLSYAHAALSDDKVTINMSGPMLAEVSSTSKDTTDAAIQSLGDLTKEVQKLQAVVAPDTAKPYDVIPGQRASCTTPVSSSLRMQLPAGTWDTDGKGTGCVVIMRASVYKMGDATGFAASQHLKGGADSCSSGICFPLTQEVKVTVTAYLASQPETKVTQVYYEAVPSDTERGYVAFDRRAFVENTTDLKFANGMLSSFQSTDPSSISATIEVATHVLDDVQIAIPVSTQK